MNLEEAKNILQLCRPGHPEDLEDPVIAEALELCQKNADLREWFEAQQAFDLKFAERLKSVNAPTDLESSILAGMRIHEANASKDDKTETPPAAAPKRSTNWWTRSWIGIAAAIAILCAVALIPDKSAPEQVAVETPRNDAVSPKLLEFLAREIQALRAESFAKIDKNPYTLKAYLDSQNTPSPNAIPARFSQSETIGCVIFDHQGTKLGMICFQEDNVYHLITADREGFPMKLTSEPQYFQIENQAFKLWTEGEKVQILSVNGTQQDLPEYI